METAIIYLPGEPSRELPSVRVILKEEPGSGRTVVLEAGTQKIILSDAMVRRLASLHQALRP